MIFCLHGPFSFLLRCLRWASNEWATSKRQFLDSLGHRALRDLGLKGTVYPGGSAPSALALMSSPSPMSPYNRGAGGGGAFPAAVAVTPSITSRMNAMMGDASADLSVLLKNQAAIVRALNQSVAEMTVRRTGAGAMGGCPCPCASLAKAIAIPQENVTDPNGLTTRDLINYQGTHHSNRKNVLLLLFYQSSHPFPSMLRLPHYFILPLLMLEKACWKCYPTWSASKHHPIHPQPDIFPRFALIQKTWLALY